MRKLFLVYAGTVIFLHVVLGTNAQDVSTGECTDAAGVVEITSEEEMSEFADRGCVSYIGYFQVENTDTLTNVDRLVTIETIENGGLSIDNNLALQSLYGLRNLRGTIDGRLLVQGNAELGDLSGLEGVVGIAGDLFLAGNPQLTSLLGLKGLLQVGSITVMSNNALLSLDGLENIGTITSVDSGRGASLYIESNAALRSIAGLSGINGDLRGAMAVWSNPRLESLQGIFGIRAVGTEQFWEGYAVYIIPPADDSWCVTPAEVRALRAICEASAEYGGNVNYCAPLSDRDWWDPSRCEFCPSDDNVLTTTPDAVSYFECDDLEEGWRDDYNDDCASIEENNWCPDYGHIAASDGQTPNEVCCACGGGTQSTEPTSVFPYERLHSTCGEGVPCDYKGGGRCMCPLGSMGAGCTTRTPKVNVLVSTFNITEPDVDAVFEIDIPLSRSSNTINPTAIELFLVYGEGSATPLLSDSLTTIEKSVVGDASLDVDDTFNATLEVCESALKTAADFEFVPPFDNITWSSETDGHITAYIRIFHDAVYEPNETFSLRLGYHFDLHPDSVLEGDLEIMFSILDGVPGKASFAETAYSVSESETLATVVLNRVGGSTGDMTVVVGVDTAASTATNASLDFDFVSAKVFWEDKDDMPKSVAIRLLNDEMYEALDETIVLRIE